MQDASGSIGPKYVVFLIANCIVVEHRDCLTQRLPREVLIGNRNVETPRLASPVILSGN